MDATQTTHQLPICLAADPGFLGGTSYLAKICRKLHENEKKGLRGWDASKILLSRSVTDVLQVSVAMKFLNHSLVFCRTQLVKTER